MTEKTANERRSRVKRLRAKQLQDFITKTKQQILGKIKKDKPSKSRAAVQIPQPVEYQPIDMEAVDSSLIADGIYDDKPLIFFGNEKYTKEVIEDPQEIQNILKSFNNFRYIIEAIENEKDEPSMDNFRYFT